MMRPASSIAATVTTALGATDPNRGVWIALSGGLDSSLLLNLAVAAADQYPRRLQALHVHHGLQSCADDFEAHCRALCRALEIPLSVVNVRVAVEAGEGVEGAARRARYNAFQQTIPAGDTLWLAQHLDDQAETFLLAALRGSGVGGLAAMPAERQLAGIRLQRPLLEVPRADLEAEAQRRCLAWSEDPSNAQTTFDRNFLRHAILPQLKERWPQASRLLARSAHWMGEADGLLAELADEDLQRLGGRAGELPLAALGKLSASRQRLLIRHCLRQLGLPTPPEARLATLLEQLSARDDAQVRVSWPGVEARCWRGTLWLMSDTLVVFDTPRDWDGHTSLVTDRGEHQLALSPLSGQAMELLVLRPRGGGETLRLAKRGQRDLKRLLQELGVPTWRRQAVAVIWYGATTVAALDMAEGRWLVVAEGWQAQGPWWASGTDESESS